MAGKKLMFLAITALTLSVLQADEDVEVKSFAVELTVDNFDEAIAKNNHFVKFFAPWDGWSRPLNPIWEELAKTMHSKAKPKVIIANVDCTKDEKLCLKYEIPGYPRTVFFKLNETVPIDFLGDRSMPSFTAFIEEILKENNTYFTPKIIKGKPVQLDKQKFSKYIARGKHFIYVDNDYREAANRFALIWDQLAKSLEDEIAVSIDEISSTHIDLEIKYKLEFFWFEDGKKIAEYTGPLKHDDLYAYVKNMLKNNDSHKKLQVMELTAENFQQTIATGVTFVNFYDLSCEKCKKLTSIWNELAEEMHSRAGGIKIALVDCSSAEIQDLCNEQKIEEYPSLIAYKNGERQDEFGQSLQDLISFITKFIGHDEL